MGDLEKRTQEQLEAQRAVAAEAKRLETIAMARESEPDPDRMDLVGMLEARRAKLYPCYELGPRGRYVRIGEGYSIAVTAGLPHDRSEERRILMTDGRLFKSGPQRKVGLLGALAQIGPWTRGVQERTFARCDSYSLVRKDEGRSFIELAAAGLLRDGLSSDGSLRTQT